MTAAGAGLGGMGRGGADGCRTTVRGNGWLPLVPEWARISEMSWAASTRGLLCGSAAASGPMPTAEE